MKRLTLTYQGRKIVSDVFNMKAYRLMYDALSGDGLNAAFLDSAAVIGLAAIFDGTELTEDVLMSGAGIDGGELIKACGTVMSWHSEITKKHLKKSEKAEPQQGHPVLSLYKSLLGRHLPDELDRQPAELFFDVMFTENNDPGFANDMPESQRDLYEV